MHTELNPLIFREYDIRGVAETDLTDEVIELIGRSLATVLTDDGVEECVVGMDVRLSSPRIKEALVRGLNGSGMDVVDIATVPTPLLYYSVLKLGTGAGVMVTGSHNPIQFNGLKITRGITTIYGDEIKEIYRVAKSGILRRGQGGKREMNIIPDYLADVKSRIQLDREVRLVIDAGNGTAGKIALGLFRDLGCEVIGLYCEPDGNFPHHLPDPTIEEYMRDLSEKVTETGAEVGVGYDGDADRIGAVDENGDVIFGDKLLAIFAADTLTRHPGSTVIFDVKCSQGLLEYLKKHNGNPFMWKTGHSLLKAKMKELGAKIGGEMSGHMFFADDYYGFDDAIFASLRLCEIISRHRGKVSSLLDGFPKYISTPEIRIDCPDDEKFRVVRDVGSELTKRFDVIDIDGVRVVIDEGWGLLRASNTQPVLVLRFEARDQEGFREIRELFREALMKYPFVDWKAI